MKPSRRKFLAVTGSAAVTSVAGVGAANAATLSDVPVPDNTSMMYPTMGTDAENPTATLYGNYKCPFTQEFVKNVLPEIVEEHVKTGKMNVRFRTISYEPYGRGSTHGTSTDAFISDSDPTISATGLGVWEQDPESYWKYFETMFSELVSGTVTPESLTSRMKQSGVDNIDEIVAQTENGKYDGLVKDSHDQALDLKMKHTPTFEMAESTLTGPGLDETINFIKSNISSAISHLPKQDKNETTTESSSSSSGSSTNTITFDGNSAQGWANYEVTVSGEFKQDRTMSASLEDSDSVSGSTASGGVGPWKDTFTYTGEITDLSVSQAIDVLKNGEPLDLEKVGATVGAKKLNVKPASDSSDSNRPMVENAISGACGRR